MTGLLSFRLTNQPPTQIVTPLTNLTIEFGKSASFAVVATGTEPLTYLWKFDGTNILGLTLNAITLGPPQTTNVGTNTVQVQVRGCDVVTSSATLTVKPIAPQIVTQPTSQTVAAGSDVSFSLVVTGTPPLEYQWQFSGVNLVGATNQTLLLADVDLNDAGSYKVVISNALGSVTSQPVVLTVQRVLSVLLLADAVDTATLYWRTGGNTSWSAQTNVTHDGNDAAMSGATADNQESWLENTVAGPGSLTFWWKVSCESGFDGLRFFVSGAQQGKISGEVDWEQKTFNIPAGLQTLRWQYAKDGSASSGQDKS